MNAQEKLVATLCANTIAIPLKIHMETLYVLTLRR